jgi:hypothetical protein
MRRRLPDDLGKGYVHWMIPDDLVESSETAVSIIKEAGILTDILLNIKQNVDYQEVKRAWDAIVRAKDETREEALQEVKAKSVELDLDDKIFSAFRRHSNRDSTPYESHSLKEFLFYALPTVLLAAAGGSGWGVTGCIGGMFVGLLGGAFLNSRRRR